MRIIFFILIVAYGFSISAQKNTLQKQCFDEGNASFAQKTKEKIVFYGDKNNPKISLVKYQVTNNPDSIGYFDDSFYLVELPKELLAAFSVKNWNDYLCGSFYPFAYPNVNELTSIQSQNDISHISYDDKYYFFRVVPWGSGVITPESMDSFSVSIPGNVGYNYLYPISKIYPTNHIDHFNREIIDGNSVFKSLIDNVIKLSKIKDFEERRKFIKKLKEKEAPLIESIEEFNNYIDEFNDVKNVNQNMDVYAQVDKYLSEMDYKFSRARHLMTRNSEAFAEAVHLFYENFDKEAKRYLRKIKEKKSKETEKNLMEFSEKTLKDAIGMIQRGIERLGYSGNVNDRQIAYLLNDYESAYTEYLDKIESGNHGAIKIAKKALSEFQRNYSYIFDGEKNEFVYKVARDEENDDEALVVRLDDGTFLMLFGSLKNGEDHRILIRSPYSSMSSLVFDADGKNFRYAFVSMEYIYKDYLPPIQVIFSGNANNIKIVDEAAQLINSSTFPKYEKFYSVDDYAFREKLGCVFDAVDGDMKKFNELAGAKSFKMASGTFVEKNKSFEALSCLDGKIVDSNNPKNTQSVVEEKVSPKSSLKEGKLKIKKIAKQQIGISGKSQLLYLNDYVTSANCDLDEIKWSVKKSKHLVPKIKSTSALSVKASDDEWCGEEEITVRAETPQGGRVTFPIKYEVQCDDE